MTLQSSGPISFNNINVELGVAGTTSASLGQASYRTLAGVPSGAISLSNFYGKSNRVAISYTFSAHTANASLNVAAIGGYVAGRSDITITVNTGIYLYSTGTGTPGLTLSGGTTGDTITLVNNGFIMGQGGSGGVNPGATPGSPGGIGLQLGYPITINNTNPVAYIGGGGGGGGSSTPGSGGGGGAGGGAGGRGVSSLGGAGGGIGAVGANGAEPPSSPGSAGGRGGGAGGGGGGTYTVRSVFWAGGGGGGRIFPGVGGVTGFGNPGGNGGSANNAAGSATYAGGGGGWGASGGPTPTRGGGSGGRAVYLNSQSVTWVSGNTTRVYGAVSN